MRSSCLTSITWIILLSFHNTQMNNGKRARIVVCVIGIRGKYLRFEHLTLDDENTKNENNIIGLGSRSLKIEI